MTLHYIGLHCMTLPIHYTTLHCIYPLVNVYITMEKITIFLWENPLFRLGHVQ